MTRLTRVWAKGDPFGTELAELTIGEGILSALGFAIGVDPLPYRLEYELTTAAEYATERLLVRARGQGWRRALELGRDGAGRWSCRAETEGAVDLPAPGGDADALAGALDCDLALSPLTNSMPVLRHRLHEGGGPLDFLMAWVSVPDLAVHPSRQRYAFVRSDGQARVVRFESLDDEFAADVTFDRDGVVVDYPRIARRVG